MSTGFSDQIILLRLVKLLHGRKASRMRRSEICTGVTQFEAVALVDILSSPSGCTGIWPREGFYPSRQPWKKNGLTPRSEWQRSILCDARTHVMAGKTSLHEPQLRRD